MGARAERPAPGNLEGGLIRWRPGASRIGPSGRLASRPSVAASQSNIRRVARARLPISQWSPALSASVKRRSASGRRARRRSPPRPSTAPAISPRFVSPPSSASSSVSAATSAGSPRRDPRREVSAPRRHGGVGVHPGDEPVLEGVSEPGLGLGAAPRLPGAARLARRRELLDRAPGLGQAGAGQRRDGPRPRPAVRIAGPRAEEAKGAGVVGAGAPACGLERAVGLVDEEEVGHLHDAALDALQLVAAAGAIAGRRRRSSRRPWSRTGRRRRSRRGPRRRPGLDRRHRLARAPGDAAERPPGSGEGRMKARGVAREPLHPGLVAEDRAAGAGRGRVDGEDRELRPRADQVRPRPR